jgi:hemoglobin
MNQQERPETAPPGFVDDALIDKLMRAFYARVRVDPLIGPVFNSRITDWEPHIARICDFWSAVMLRTGRYRGQPMSLHVPLPIDSAHFDRWLAIFERTAYEVCSEEVAREFVERARTIGRSLEMGVAQNRLTASPGSL